MNKIYNKFLRETFKDNGVKVIVILLLTLVKVFVMIMIPRVYQHIIDRALLERNKETFIVLVISLASLYLLDVLTGTYKEISATIISEKSAYKLRKKLNGKLLSTNYFEIASKNISEITSLLTNEIQIVSNHISNGIFSIIGNIILFLVSASIIFVVDQRIFLLTSITVLLYYANGKFWSKKIKRASEINLQENRNVIQIITDNHNNLITNKVMNLKGFITGKFEQTYNDFYDSSVNLKRIQIRYRNISMLLVYIMIIIIWIIAGKAVIDEHLSVGSLTALISYQTMILGPIQSISNYIQSYNITITALNRLDAFFCMEDDSVNSEGVCIESIDKISLENVQFEFNGKVVFTDINMMLEKGDVLGIAGESGSGKSTLLKILSGLYRPTQGNVLINDKEFNDIDKSSIYSKIAYLEQDSKLFNGSVNENVDLGRSIERNVIAEVLKRLKLIKGSDYTLMDYKVKDSGDNLSGGQKKRVDIARALIKDPELILLDESLSPLDKNSKKHVFDFLSENKEGKIIVIVSHNKEDLIICNKYIELKAL